MIGDKGRETSRYGQTADFEDLRFYQGRPFLASDANEALDLQTQAREKALVNVIGAVGVPKKNAGFGVTVDPGHTHLTVGAGHLYVAGARFSQPMEQQISLSDVLSDVLSDALSDVGADDTGDLILIACCRKTETDFLDHPYLREPALAGPDTAGRVEASVDLQLLPLSSVAAANRLSPEALIAKAQDGQLLSVPGLHPRNGRAGFSLGTVEAEGDAACMIRPEGGYSRGGNFNYLVEIHHSGSTGTATFKWARDDVRALLVDGPDGWRLSEAPTDDQRRFEVSNTIEIKGADQRRSGENGVLGRIQSIDQQSGAVSFAGLTGALGDLQAPLTITRWDNPHDDAALRFGIPTTAQPQALENGVMVAFSGRLSVGDFWYCAARARSGALLWPPYPLPAGTAADPMVPPFNWGPHCAGLAVIRNGKEVVDLRPPFPDLTHLHAEDITIDAIGGCGFADGMTVQAALQQLCDRSQPICTLTVRPDHLDPVLAAQRSGLAALPTLSEALRMWRGWLDAVGDIEDLSDHSDAFAPRGQSGFSRRMAIRFTQGEYTWPGGDAGLWQNLHSLSLAACDGAPVSINVAERLVFERCLSLHITGIHFISQEADGGLSAFGGKDIYLSKVAIRRGLDTRSAPLRLWARRRISVSDCRIHIAQSSGDKGYRPALQIVDSGAQTLLDNVQSNGSLILGAVMPVKATDDPVAQLLEGEQTKRIKGAFPFFHRSNARYAPHQSSSSLQIRGCKFLTILPGANMMTELSEWAQAGRGARAILAARREAHINREMDGRIERVVSGGGLTAMRPNSATAIRRLRDIAATSFLFDLMAFEVPAAAQVPFRSISVADSDILRGTSILVGHSVQVHDCRFAQFGDSYATIGQDSWEHVNGSTQWQSELDQIVSLGKGVDRLRPWYPVCITVAQQASCRGNLGYPQQGQPQGWKKPERASKDGWPAILDFSRPGPNYSQDFELHHAMFEILTNQMVTLSSRFLR